MGPSALTWSRGIATPIRTTAPRSFCFDGAYLLMLQFRADTREAIKDIRCEVDHPSPTQTSRRLCPQIGALPNYGLGPLPGQMGPPTPVAR